MQIVLYQPEIPPNTGSIARLCAATNTRLNLIEPLGFSLEDKYLKRAGLDYWPHVDLKVWPDWNDFQHWAAANHRVVMSSARAGTPHHAFAYHADDLLVFGPETTGLPAAMLNDCDACVRIPIWGQVRSINLANAVSVVIYEAYRQIGLLDDK